MMKSTQNWLPVIINVPDPHAPGRKMSTCSGYQKGEVFLPMKRIYKFFGPLSLHTGFQKLLNKQLDGVVLKETKRLKK